MFRKVRHMSFKPEYSLPDPSLHSKITTLTNSSFDAAPSGKWQCVASHVSTVL